MRNTPDPRDSLALALGRLVLAWGQLEAILSLTVLMLHYEWGGHPTEKEPPRALKRKLDFIENCCKDNALLAPYETIRLGGEAIAVAARNLGDQRHSLMHGNILGEPGDLLIMQVDRIRKGGAEAVAFTDEESVVTLLDYILDVIPIAGALTHRLREARHQRPAVEHGRRGGPH